MTGAPGDAWPMDLRVLPAGSPNAAERPRVMLTFRYERSDLLREVAWRTLSAGDELRKQRDRARSRTLS